jgi:hypothetical protein
VKGPELRAGTLTTGYKCSMPAFKSSTAPSLLLAALALVSVACSEGDTPPPSPACPKANGPTQHQGDVSSDETWTAEASPHILTGSVRVRDGATLTINPCAEVRLGEGMQLAVGWLDSQARLVAEGSQEQPIHFVGADGARWGNIWIRKNATASLAHVLVEGGGSTSVNVPRGASILVQGERVQPLQARLKVDQVTVRDSSGLGVFMQDNSAFEAGSNGLVIVGSGDEENPYPLTIDAAAVGTVPSGRYTGNHRDEIELPGSSADIATAVRMSDHGVPYRVTGIPGSCLQVASADGGAVLTLEPGVTLRFDEGTCLWISHGSSAATTAMGALRAVGTREKPIVFTSSADQPAAGDWMGLQFRGSDLSPDNALEHARIEYAGYSCSCGGFSCESEQEAGVLFMGARPTTQFIQNTRFVSISGHGINRGWTAVEGAQEVSFLPTNSFEDVAWCSESLHRDYLNGCPNPPPCP